jgi:hypothetical protein
MIRTRAHHLTAALATCLALGALSSTASANNRAFDALSAVPIDAAAAACFNNHDGSSYTIVNRCSSNNAVLLPMSVDGTGMWYYGTIYGKGWIDGSGVKHNVSCQLNTAYHDGTFYWGGWQSFDAGSGAFGGAQTIPLGYAPIAVAGDTLFALCWMDSNTNIFSYGWN